MTECDEVADRIAADLAPWPTATFDDCRHVVKHKMLVGESEQVIDNVAWSLWQTLRNGNSSTQGLARV